MTEKKLLSREELAAALEEKRKQIPQTVDAVLDYFYKESNDFSQNLLTCIGKFDDPTVGFAVFRDFLRTGDFSTLRKRVDECMSRTNSGEDEALHGHMPQEVGFIVATYNSIRVLTEIEGTPADPLIASIHPIIQQACIEQAFRTFEDLYLSKHTPPFTESMLYEHRNDFLAGSQALFDSLAEEMLSDTSPERKVLKLPETSPSPTLRFGAEMELLLPSEMRFGDIMRHAIASLENQGLDVNGAIQHPKQDADYNQWVVTYDISILSPLNYMNAGATGNIGGGEVEVVSPILEGEEGVEKLRLAIAGLKEAGFVSNASCGFHVHVDMEETTLEQRKNLAVAFIRNETAFDEYLSPSRRGTHSRYSKSLQNVSEVDVFAAKDTAELIKIVNGGQTGSKLNMTNLDFPSAAQTVEFRGEGGAGYLDQAAAYTQLVAHFAEQALNNPEITVAEVLASLQKTGKSFVDTEKARRMQAKDEKGTCLAS